MKMIGNFETIAESTNTPPYDQRFRSYDHCKLGVLIESFIDRSNCLDIFEL
jgi:hypothetical protein